MSTLADLPLRAQTLAGQIKQADADVVECDTLKLRAEKSLQIACEAYDKAVERAASLRTERDELRAEADRLLGMVGEPTAPVAGGEVSKSADAGGVVEAPPVSCDHVWNYNALDDKFVCSRCGEAMPSAFVEDNGPLHGLRRVAF